MTREEFNEIKCIALEMKANGWTEVITKKPIGITTPYEGVIVARPTAKTPTTPYAVAAQVQPVRVHHDQPKKQSEANTPFAQRKSEILVKVKQEDGQETTRECYCKEYDLKK